MLANALIHKGNREVAHHRIEQFVELGDMHNLLLLGQLVEGRPDLDTKGIEIELVA